MLLAGCAELPGSVQYQPLVTEQKSIPQVSVTVSYKEDGIYQVEVDNDLPGTISLQWNSSTYVNTGGDATQLIHIQNLDNFPANVPKKQIPSPIASGARLNTHFVGESWIDFARRVVSPRPRDAENKARIYLSFNIKGKLVYWTGDVAFVADK